MSGEKRKNQHKRLNKTEPVSGMGRKKRILSLRNQMKKMYPVGRSDQLYLVMLIGHVR